MEVELQQEGWRETVIEQLQTKALQKVFWAKDLRN